MAGRFGPEILIGAGDDPLRNTLYEVRAAQSSGLGALVTLYTDSTGATPINQSTAQQFTDARGNYGGWADVGYVDIYVPSTGVVTRSVPVIDTTLSGAATPDATSSVKGKVQLAGDLAGTAASPQIAAGAIVNADVNAAAGITHSKMESDARARANHTGTQTASTVSDFSTAADARITAQKGAASGLAELDSGSKVPTARMATGTPDGTKFLRDDRTWVTPTATPGIVVQDEGGTPYVARGKLNIVGAGVTATDDAGGDRVTVTIPGLSVSPMAINARDYLAGTGAAETVAAINALKAVLDGKIVHFPPATDYNLTNMLSTTGGVGFVFTKPTEFRGPGTGEDQATGGQTVGRLQFPSGCHGIEIQGNGSGGGAAGSRVLDLFMTAPAGAAGTAEDFDGIRIRAYDCVIMNTRVQGWGRDGVNADTNASSNANMTVLIGVRCWYNRRHGVYLVGTNSNVINLQTPNCNNNGAYTTTNGSHTLPVSTLNLATGGGRDFRTGGGTFSFTVGGVTYRASYTGKTTSTLTGVTWPGAVYTLVLPTASGISSGVGLYLGGPATPNDVSNPLGGDTCTVTGFHGSYNAEGGIMDNGNSNLYLNPYMEGTNATYPHSWRFIIGPDSYYGGLWAPKFGGFPVHNLTALANGAFSYNRRAGDGWDVRQLPIYGLEGTPRSTGATVVTGAKGGNAALTSMIAALSGAGRIVDETT